MPNNYFGWRTFSKILNLNNQGSSYFGIIKVLFILPSTLLIILSLIILIESIIGLEWTSNRNYFRLRDTLMKFFAYRYKSGDRRQAWVLSKYGRHEIFQEFLHYKFIWRLGWWGNLLGCGPCSSERPMSQSYLTRDWSYSLYLISNYIRKSVWIVVLFWSWFWICRRSTTLWIEEGLERIVKLLIVLSLKYISI